MKSSLSRLLWIGALMGTTVLTLNGPAWAAPAPNPASAQPTTVISCTPSAGIAEQLNSTGTGVAKLTYDGGETCDGTMTSISIRVTLQVSSNGSSWDTLIANPTISTVYTSSLNSPEYKLSNPPIDEFYRSAMHWSLKYPDGTTSTGTTFSSTVFAPAVITVP